MLVVQILTEGGECSAEPFLELEEETWEPLIRVRQIMREIIRALILNLLSCMLWYS